MKSAIEASDMRAEIAQSLAKDATILGEMADLTNAMGDTQRSLMRIEDYAIHLATGQGSVERNTTDLQATSERIESHTTALLDAAGRAQGSATDLAAILSSVQQISADIARQREVFIDSVQQLSTDIARQRETLVDQVEALSVRDGTIRLALDAIRMDQRRADDGARTSAREQVRVIETASALVDDKIVHLLKKSDQGLSLAGVHVSRLDTLVQRAVLPLGPDVLMRMPDGLLLVPADDAALVAAVWETGGRLEKGTVEVATSLVEDGDVVVDVGANVGLLTIPLARRVGATGRVTAVEPSSRVADLLRRSAFLNFGPECIDVYHCAAGATSSTATLNIGLTAGHSSLLALPSSRGTEQVEVRRLDDIIPPGTRLRLIKIDVEGSELEVWRGMTRILLENPDLAVIVEFGTEHLRRADIGIGAWLDVFGSSGFLPYVIDEKTGTVAPLRASQELAEVVSINLLLLRQPVSVYPRLMTR